MIGITTYDSSRTEPLLYIQNFEMTEELNGNFEIAFNSLNIPENVGHDLIQEEAVVYVNDIGFRIKQLETTKTLKRVIAISLYFDNVVTRRKPIYGGTRKLEDFLKFLYEDTGWTYTVEDITESRLIPNFGDDNIQSLTEVLLSEFECERKIMPNKHLHFAKKIGPDLSAQYRYGYNIKALTEKVDTSHMYSRIEGRGADGLSVMYISPNEPQIGIREAEPFVDEEFKDATLLAKRASREIIDYPSVSFELDAVELTDKELGERVWLIYEPLGISFQTRILTKISTLRNMDIVTSSVVLGNAKPRTLSDILAEQSVQINDTNKQVRSKFEQTNDTITLAVEELGASIAAIELHADSIELSVNNRITSEVAAINVRANAIELSVSGVAGQISSKVSYTDYNGNEIASRINQSATTISIQASKINLIGAVNVLSDITGNLGTITSGNIDIYNAINVGGGIYMRSSAFKVLRMGADPIDYGSISVSGGSMTIDAGNVINFVSPVNFNGVSISGLNTTAKWG